MSVNSVLTVENVEQSFASGFWMRPKKVLHGVSLSVPERAIFGFLGANGAGKTTLIHMIVGLRRPKAGQVLVSGHASHTLEARRRIGYLPERPYFHEHLTGEQFLLYLGTLSGLSKKQILDRVPDVLATVGLKQARHRELKTFSKGMLQRIGIAQAILHDPQFLVFDEPMSGLDPVGRKEIRELIVELAAQGRTVFFSTHVIPDVEAICDQVAILRAGRVLGAGPIAGFLQNYRESVEVAFRGIAEDKVRSDPRFADFRPFPEGFRGVIRGADAARATLDAVLAQGGQLLWFTPEKASLEVIFERGGQEDVDSR